MQNDNENVARARDMVLKLKGLRIKSEALEREIRETQAATVEMLRMVDPDTRGVMIELGDETLAGYVQQGKAPEIVDTASLIEFLEKRDKFASVSTRVLDMAKLNAEIKAGNIPARSVRKFFSEGKQPNPYVRFAKPKPNSI